MNGMDFIKDMIKRSKTNFVFLTYSQSLLGTKERTILLGNYLISNGINVIFDGGTMPAGSNNYELMQLIAHPNCCHVLMVCDSTYTEKWTHHTGGVYTELELLRNKIWISPNKTIEASKVIPLIAESTSSPSSFIPDFLQGATYLMFLDASQQTLKTIFNQVNDCRISSKNTPSGKDLKTNAKYYYEKANNAYDNEQYEAAKNYIETAIQTYLTIRKPSHYTLIDYYDLASIIYLRINDSTNAQHMVKQAISLETRKRNPDFQKLARFYANLSLSNTACVDEQEANAEVALTYALKSGVNDISYYYSLYANALFFAQKYKDAYDYTLRSYHILNNQKQLDTKDGVKCICNLAEISVYLASSNRRADNISHLHDAVNYILSAIQHAQLLSNFNDSEYYECYRIAIFVFQKIQAYYTM